MSEWWTYRPSDFLMFAPRTYYRLFEIYNVAWWPAHLLALGIGLALVLLSIRGRAWAARAACVLLAACWLWVALAFHLQRYATINWAATGFAAAFAVEGLLLIAGAGFAVRVRLRAAGDRVGYVGFGALIFALVVQPWIGMLLGRPWLQAEVFGLAPDPTAVGTLGVLLLLRSADGAERSPRTRALTFMLWPIPVLWCLVSALTLWTMDASDAFVPLGAALVVLIAARWAGKSSRPT